MQRYRSAGEYLSGGDRNTKVCTRRSAKQLNLPNRRAYTERYLYKSSISSPQHRTHKARTSKHPHASSTTAPGAVKPSHTITESQAAKLVQYVASGRAILSEKVRRSVPQYERAKRKERSGGTSSVL